MDITTKRFFDRCLRPTRGCWTWTGYVNGGYGIIEEPGRRSNGGGKRHKAHRWSYEFFIGPIPNGLVIDHRCNNKLCVNPDHLRAVTSQENTLRGHRKNVGQTERSTSWQTA